MSVIFQVSGLEDAKRLYDRMPSLVEEAAYFAINDTLRDEEVAVRRGIETQINFPKGYLRKSDRYGIGKRAKLGSLVGYLYGRDRPTSLARFAGGATRENSRGRSIFVRVSKSGGAVELKRAFLIQLRNGNLGLAIRLPEGQRPDNAYEPVQLTQNNGNKLLPIWLLYGPSVDQVMSGVIVGRTNEIQDALSRNFDRQLRRLTSRG